MNNFTILGKYLDQPKLVEKVRKTVPAALVVGSAAYAFNHIHKTKRDEKKKELIKTVVVLTSTISSALLAPRVAGKFFKAHVHSPDCHCSFDIKKSIDYFIKKNKNITSQTKQYLQEACTDSISFSKVKTICTELGEDSKAKEFLFGEHGLIPDPENIDSKHIFGEIGRLSVMGLLPVVGGIAGGVAADKITEKDWKSRIPNKIKEGSYQYLANIFLCNVGAGAALAGLEKANVKSKSARAIGMIGGIIAFGLVGGSAMANFISKKCIDPLLGKNKGECDDKFSFRHHHGHGLNGCKKQKGLYSERTPEALDVGLHVDDIATVAVLSGLKWIEPALPILYSISGYRAGIGYRNVEQES